MIDKKRLRAVLVLGFVFVFSAAETLSGLEIKDLKIKGLETDGLPDSRDLHVPRSSISQATMGTIGGDGDSFMSVLEWNSIENLTNFFALAGVDEYGLSLGYAKKLGGIYVGASYSGSLIDEIFRRATNQDVVTLRKETKYIERSDKNTYESSLSGPDDKTPSGETVSNNDINLILGSGIFGLRFGFSQWIKSVDFSVDDPWEMNKTLESSLKPSLELGFNFMAGSVRVKPALRLAFDIHEYDSHTAYEKKIDATDYWITQHKLINFYEPSAGFTLGFDFSKSENSSAEFAFDVDAAFRLYRSETDPDHLRSTWHYDEESKNNRPDFFPFTIDPDDLDTITLVNYDVTIPSDLRITGAPSFVFSSNFTPRFTLGAKIEAGVDFSIITINQTDSKGDFSATSTTLGITPDFSIGFNYSLIPDHFSLHGGLGLELFSFRQVVIESDITGTDSKETTKTVGLPSARFATGLTLNFTEAVAMDAMAISSGLSIETTKFNLLLSVKR